MMSGNLSPYQLGAAPGVLSRPEEPTMLEPIVKRCAGLDVHKMRVVATVLLEQPDGQVSQETRSVGTFRPDREALCAWLGEAGVELAVMESTGNYWKSIYAALESASIKT
jgi:transposase